MAIIVIVDDMCTGKISKRRLEEAGHTIFWYYIGHEALDELNNGLKYDLALVDISLDDIDGNQIINRMKELYPDKPVICTSCYPILNTRADYRHWNLSDIAEVVESALKEKQR